MCVSEGHDPYGHVLRNRLRGIILAILLLTLAISLLAVAILGTWPVRTCLEKPTGMKIDCANGKRTR